MNTTNPFELLEQRLLSIEGLLLDLKHGELKSPVSPNSNITREEAANILHVTLPTLHSYTMKGKIQGYRIGRRVLYKKNEIEQAATAISTNKKTR
jgi:excisionase family DNA binding protein